MMEKKFNVDPAEFLNGNHKPSAAEIKDASEAIDRWRAEGKDVSKFTAKGIAELNYEFRQCEAAEAAAERFGALNRRAAEEKRARRAAKHD